MGQTASIASLQRQVSEQDQSVQKVQSEETEFAKNLEAFRTDVSSLTVELTAVKQSSAEQDRQVGQLDAAYKGLSTSLDTILQSDEGKSARVSELQRSLGELSDQFKVLQVAFESNQKELTVVSY